MTHSKYLVFFAFYTVLSATPAMAATTVMGYFDTEYFVNDIHHFDGGQFDQHRLSLLLQHELPGYKFFAELEYKHAPAIEDRQNGAGARGSGEVEIERAWTDISLAGDAALLRVGKIMEPGLWTQNHYPNLQMSIVRPRMTNLIFKESFVGLEIHGTPLGGFHYHLWTMRGNPNVESNAITGHPVIQAPAQKAFSSAGRAGYLLKFTDGYADLSLSAAHYADAVVSNPKQAELELNWRQIKLWTSYASKSSLTGWYSVLSYTIPFGEKELSPYLFIDSIKQDNHDRADYHFAYGLNYKPRPEIAFKVELGHDSAPNDDSPHETAFRSAFVLFFQ